MDFTTAQSQLSAARAVQDSAQLAVSRAAAQVRHAQDPLDVARRETLPQHDTGRIAQLAQAARRAQEQQAAARRTLQSARADVASATAVFAEFSTPQRNVSQLSDSSPFLLFPVRIETRFRTVSAPPPPTGIPVAAAAHQLLVRI